MSSWLPIRHIVDMGPGFEVSTRRIGDVLVVKLVGLYGLHAHAVVQRAACELLAAEPARCVIADLRGAIAVMDEADRDLAKQRTLSIPATRQIPVAVVVAPALLGRVTAYCELMWVRRLLWFPSTDFREALDWALSRHARERRA